MPIFAIIQSINFHVLVITKALANVNPKHPRLTHSHITSREAPVEYLVISKFPFFPEYKKHVLLTCTPDRFLARFV